MEDGLGALEAVYVWAEKGLNQGQQTFFLVRVETVNNFEFSGHTLSVQLLTCAGGVWEQPYVTHTWMGVAVV